MNRTTRHDAIRTVALIGLASMLAAGVAFAQEAEEPSAKLIKMTVESFKWTPNVIRVPVGTKLRLEIKSWDAPHRFDLKAYGLEVLLPENETTVVEFVADKPGKFRWKCGRPCGNGCAKMTGRLIVEEGESD